MTQEELAVKLEAVDQRAKSNTHRIETLERDHQALNRLATAVEVMAAKQEHLAEGMERLSGKVDAMEAEPGRRWRLLVEKIFSVVAAALVGWYLARLGL